MLDNNCEWSQKYTIECKNFLVLFEIFTGGRGFIQELWPGYGNKPTSQIRDTYTSTYPINSTKTVEYATQQLSSSVSRYNYEHNRLAARYEGLFKPPYSGYFNLLISGDDSLDFWMSHNRSSIGMVSSSI